MQTNTDKNNVQSFLELVNTYPSPHNGQPMRLKLDGLNDFSVFFQKERGLQSSDISFIFSFVSIGVFIEHVTYVANALGHTASVTLDLPTIDAMKGEGLLHCARIQMAWNTHGLNEDAVKAIGFRQTSRKKYNSGITPPDFERLTAIAKSHGMQLRQLDEKQAQQTIWLNQRAVFDDMFDEPVRQELDHWLRYSQAQKQAKKDGLAYDCMELNGPIMRQIVSHPGILHAPGISKILQKYYVRTMKDKSSVGFMMAPFAVEQDAYAVGTVISRMWMAMSEQGYYLHPFGTIMSNHAAHADFLRLVDIDDENRAQKYLVFIFRAGTSNAPVRSLRLPINEHLMLGD